MKHCPQWLYALIVGGLLMAVLQCAHAQGVGKMRTQTQWDGKTLLYTGERNGQMAFVVIIAVDEVVEMRGGWEDFTLVKSSGPVIPLGQLGKAKGQTELFLFEGDGVRSGTLSILPEKAFWDAVDGGDIDLPILGQVVDRLTLSGQTVELKLGPWKFADPNAAAPQPLIK